MAWCLDDIKTYIMDSTCLQKLMNNAKNTNYFTKILQTADVISD